MGDAAMRLTLREIAKSYGNQALFEHLNLEVPSGSFLCLVGKSGRGKTTLLNLMASFEPPDAGEILLEGNAVHQPGPARIMVFQTFDQLLPWKTVEENLLFPVKHGKRAGLDLDLILRRLGLEAAKHLYPHQLSGGMKQRVALGRALMARPGVLLMDEPFGSLDASTRLEMQALLVEIWEEYRLTVVFVTHDVPEAVKLGERILVLADGQLTEFENPKNQDSRALQKRILDAMQ